MRNEKRASFISIRRTKHSPGLIQDLGGGRSNKLVQGEKKFGGTLHSVERMLRAEREKLFAMGGSDQRVSSEESPAWGGCGQAAKKTITWRLLGHSSAGRCR